LFWRRKLPTGDALEKEAERLGVSTHEIYKGEYLLPLYGFGGLVVLADVTNQFSLQVRKRGEDASGNDVTLDLGEPFRSSASLPGERARASS
jgi:hypothetical protein